jgi:hypothetical protein
MIDANFDPAISESAWQPVRMRPSSLLTVRVCFVRTDTEAILQSSEQVVSVFSCESESEI